MSNGITMKYVEAGDPAGPAVLLIHGYTDKTFSYSGVIPLLDKRYRIFAIDQRGHGETDKPENGYEMRDFAADTAAFLDAMGIKSATVVGHSMGSFVAMQTTLDHSARVQRLVLIGTAARAGNEVVKELLDAVGTLTDPVPRQFAHDFQVSASSPSLPKEFMENVVNESLRLPANVWKKALAGVAARDYTPDLKNIRVRVVIFWGEKETIFKRAEQEPLIKGLPDARFIVYANSGHAPNWDQPAKFAKDLNELLADGLSKR